MRSTGATTTVSALLGRGGHEAQPPSMGDTKYPGAHTEQPGEEARYPGPQMDAWAEVE